MWARMTDPGDLYGLPLDRFVAERAALAKALRSEGDRERAAQVAKLHKPSVAAWAANQLVRTQRGAVADLFEAGDQLQRAQSELLAGRGGGDALRTAADRERAAVDHLTATARGLLTPEGHELSATVVERVRETLHAAALDQDAREQLKDGCLERELRHVGIGPGDAPGVTAPRRSGKSGRSSRGSAAKGQQAPRPSENQPQQVDAERLKAMRKAAQDARRQAERAAHDLRAAQERRDRAAQLLEKAEAVLADTRQRAEQAALAQRRREQELGDTSQRR